MQLAAVAAALAVLTVVVGCVSPSAEEPPAAVTRIVAGGDTATEPSSGPSTRTQIVVHVVSAADGRPLPDARVHVQVAWFVLKGKFWGDEYNAPEVVVALDRSGVARLEVEATDRPPRSLARNRAAGPRFGPDAVLFAECAGYLRSETSSVRLGDDEGEVPVRIALSEAATVEGEVADAATGIGVSGVRVVARKLFDPFDGGADLSCGSAVSGPDGRFRISTLRPDARLALDATVDGYGPATVEFQSGSARAESGPVRLRLTPPAVVTGVVRRADGTAAAGAKVVATARAIDDIRAFPRGLPFPFRWTVDPAAATKTAADGTFRLDALASGARYTVYAVAENPTAFAATELLGGGPRCEIVLTKQPRVFLRVISADGVPVASGSRATCWLDGHGAYNSPVGENGWMEVAPELDGIGAGERRIRLALEGHELGAVTVTTRMGEDLRTEFRLRPRKP
jgi:hypothetical protein